MRTLRRTLRLNGIHSSRLEAHYTKNPHLFVSFQTTCTAPSGPGVSHPTIQAAARKTFGMSAARHIVSAKMREAKRLAAEVALESYGRPPARAGRNTARNGYCSAARRRKKRALPSAAGITVSPDGSIG